MIQTTTEAPRSRTKKKAAGLQATDGSPANRITLPPITLPAPRSEPMAIDVASIVRHPKNRTVLATDPDVLELAASIEQLGQLDDLLLRPIAGDVERYELISGERRLVAIRDVLGRKYVSARLQELTDAEALRILAEANAKRKDLTPIERAQALADLTAPESEGGGGLTQAQAGEIYGLERSAVANAIRLLKLPEKVRDLIAKGQLPETYVRALIPTFDGPLAEATAKIVLTRTGNGTSEVAAKWGRDQFVDDVVRTLRQTYPDVTEKRESYVATYDYVLRNVVQTKGVGRQTFNLNDAIRDELAIVELPGRYRVASNLDAYKRHNLEAAKGLLAKLEKKSKANDAKQAKAAADLSPAEREKRSKERLESKLDGLARDFQGWAAAQAIAGDPRLAAIAAIWFATGARDCSHGRRSAVCRELNGGGEEYHARERFAKSVSRETSPESLLALLQGYLYEPGGEGHRPTTDVARAVLVAGDVDVEAYWIADCESDDQLHVRRWLEAMDTDQLRKELERRKIGAEAKAKKADLVAVGLTNAVRGIFPLPKAYRVAKRGTAE